MGRGEACNAVGYSDGPAPAVVSNVAHTGSLCLYSKGYLSGMSPDSYFYLVL